MSQNRYEVYESSGGHLSLFAVNPAHNDECVWAVVGFEEFPGELSTMLAEIAADVPLSWADTDGDRFLLFGIADEELAWARGEGHSKLVALLIEGGELSTWPDEMGVAAEIEFLGGQKEWNA